MRTLPLTVDEFDGLASGHGSDQALAHLAAGRAAKRRLLLWGAVRDARRLGLPVEDAVDLLRRALERSAAAVGEVLTHPQVDAWAAGFPDRPDVGYLLELAAAGAVRAGLPFTVDVTGALHLPGLGLIDAGPARLVFDGSRFTANGEPVPMRSLHRLDLTDVDGPVVVIDDRDRYRDRYAEPVADRMADPDRFAVQWRAAWQLLARDHPAHARAVRALLRSFVPLAPAEGPGERSGVSNRANGSIAIAPPATPAALARLVLHETQHLKLDALLDLVDLTRGDGRPRHHAPWRGDLRPVRSLLQGTYAHLGVAEFWRGRDVRQFAYWHGQTARAAATLAGSGELTADGERFVAGMRATLDGWAADPVPAADRHAVQVCTRVSELVWRLGVRALPEEATSALVTAWRAGDPAPSSEGGIRVGRAGGARVRILAAIHGGPVTDGDRELLAGADRAAAEQFARRIRAGQGTDDDWAGLAVAVDHTTRPEVARDLYPVVRPADPRELLRWSAG
ncbi:aKG-HExxH-type peptide beta-hydroxylase [Actinoplanes sp. G11-F43]|uniref:aKG-HExxH-type peptide beta-hydroxylase n=1 Tax=Actinoplanes sp. G11-F43 TaxID=3424130 RepID=UPI003D3336D6